MTALLADAHIHSVYVFDIVALAYVTNWGMNAGHT